MLLKWSEIGIELTLDSFIGIKGILSFFDHLI
jgi:hypothetical protein